MTSSKKLAILPALKGSLVENLNVTPIDFEKFKTRVVKKVYRVKNYYSLYILPNGQILDCRYPTDLGHTQFSAYVYNNINSLSASIYNSCLRGLDIPFEEIPYYLEEYHNLFNLSYVDPNLFNIVDKALLGDEDRICHDMGFIKISINKNLNSFTLAIPNSIFNKKVTAAQIETIEKISNLFNGDLKTILKQRQRDNMQLATQINTTLKSAHSC